MHYNHQSTLSFIEIVTSKNLVESKTDAVNLAADVLGVDVDVIVNSIIAETPSAVVKSSRTTTKKPSILNF